MGRSRVLIATAALSPLVGGLLASGSAAALGASASGGGKPAYCEQVTTLRKSIDSVAKLPNSTPFSVYKALLQKIEADASTLIDSVKADFSKQTDALRSSLSVFKTAFNTYLSTPSKATLAAYAKALGKVVDRFFNLSDAMHSKCG
jgi:hypothetical protein